MKHYQVLTILVFLITGCQAQNKNPHSEIRAESFDEFVLSYEPSKNELNEATFTAGSKILEEQKKYYKSSGRFTFSNYWNIGTAFGKLNESNELIELAFTKAITSNKDEMCQYIDVMTGMGNVFETEIPEFYSNFKKECSSNNLRLNIDIEKYANEGSFDLNLIKLFEEIKINDLKFRSNTDVDWGSQNLLDHRNQVIIDSLFNIYNEYIGRKYVGKTYESIMFLVVQHSNLDYMEKYLPVIQKAVFDKEVDVSALKYILDRISSRRNNYQYFGTQSGVKYADDEEIELIKNKYGID